MKFAKISFFELLVRAS